MAEGTQESAPLNGGQLLARLVTVNPATAASVAASVGQPLIPGLAVVLTPDAMQARLALFLPGPRVTPFRF